MLWRSVGKIDRVNVKRIRVFHIAATMYCAIVLREILFQKIMLAIFRHSDL